MFNPNIWLAIIGVLVVFGALICGVIFKPKPQDPAASTAPDDKLVNDGDPQDVSDGETQLFDIGSQDEDFGMYESSLSSWLAHHPSGSSVDRYTRHRKQQIQNVSSVNTAMLPSLADYIPYNEETRFQTPSHYSPAINPSFNNHIRSSEPIVDEEVTTLDP